MHSRWVPTGLACIATCLRRAGHTVRIHVREEELVKGRFDWDAADAHLRGLLTDFQPDMVGLSAVTPLIPETAAIARLAKQLVGERVLTVAGGPHPSALPERTLEDCPDLDAVVVGEGETAMVELAEKGPSRDIAGLVYRDGESVIRTPRRPPTTDLDRLGPPALDLFDMSFYTAPTPWLIRWLTLSATNILTSRGCPNRCRFCAGHVVSGPGVRYHSLDYVMDQVANAVERLKVEGIHFEDETFAADHARLFALCEQMRRRGFHRRVKWDCLLRVEQADAELLKAMKSAGCIQVEYGFESGSDAVLRRVAKNASLEQNRRAARLAREAGLRVFADIILGLPGETEQDVEATRRFLRWADPEVLSSARLMPLPGTPIFDELPPAVRDSLNWADYTYFDVQKPAVNLSAMSDARFEKVFHDFQKYFSRPLTLRAFLRDTPPEERAERRRLRRALFSFMVRHPLRALRLPW